MSFQIENIKQIMDNLDFAALLPSIEDVLAFAALFVRIAVMAGPLLLLGLGLYYFLAGPKEATYRAGYRCHWGMGSVQAWQYTQKLAGIIWGLLGLGLSIWMAVLCSQLRQMALNDAMWKALGALLIQAAAVLVSCGIINVLVFARFDRKGNRRLTWRELFQA